MNRIAIITILSTISFASVAKSDDPYAYTGGSLGGSNWASTYAGVHGGVGWGTAGSANTSGLNIGLLAGRNWQYDRLVFGLEGDLTYSDVKFKGFTNSFSIDWLGSFRARAGYSYDKFLFYGTGGLGVGTKEYKDITGKDRAYSIGWVGGAGIEAKITDRIGVRGEFLHYNLGADTFTTGLGKHNLNTTVNVIRAGTQVHF